MSNDVSFNVSRFLTDIVPCVTFANNNSATRKFIDPSFNIWISKCLWRWRRTAVDNLKRFCIKYSSYLFLLGTGFHISKLITRDLWSWAPHAIVYSSIWLGRELGTFNTELQLYDYLGRYIDFNQNSIKVWPHFCIKVDSILSAWCIKIFLIKGLTTR